MEYDRYSVLEGPGAGYVFYRPGWRYYPYICEITGKAIWSDLVVAGSYQWTGDSPVCWTWQFGGSSGVGGSLIPPDAEKVIAVMEVAVDEYVFGIPGALRETNFTPIFDNFTVVVTDAIFAPPIEFEGNGPFQDVGSYPSDLFDVQATGPANTTMDQNMFNPGARFYSGDSLAIAGPQPSASDPNTQWEARMWWRVARRAPFQAETSGGVPSRYAIWRDRVADGKQIDRPHDPEFTFGWMDSVQIGTIATRNKFCSYFREDDDDFRGETYDGLTPETEMIWDDCLYPGSQIEYFVTSNYVPTPNTVFYLPDTTGGYFYEFEILPGVRFAHVPDCGDPGFDRCAYHPAVLYIDMESLGAQVYIENALRTIVNGMPPCQDPYGCEIPHDRNWDRYDIERSPCCYHVPFGRGPIPGSNNGMTLSQILGYRAILVNTGRLVYNTQIHDVTYELFDEWLTSPDCESNLSRQALLLNGDGIGEIYPDRNPYGVQFLEQTLGASLYCDSFHGQNVTEPNCGAVNTSYCVRWLPTGGPFDTEIDVDAWGSWCPNLYRFHAYSPMGTGVGNRSYSAEDGLKEMSFAQILNEDLGPNANYRTVLDGVSWHHMTARDPGGDPDECPRDLPSIVEAEIAEIGTALKWCFDVEDYESIPKLVSAKFLWECQGTDCCPADIDENQPTSRINRLYQNRPNPFNPATTIQFSLAQDGPVEIAIYDVHGRRVRTLVDQTMEAGVHTLVWDGTNDEGHPVGSGIYWSQMRAGAYESKKKMMGLK
jgi:hypothetical protein